MVPQTRVVRSTVWRCGSRRRTSQAIERLGVGVPHYDRRALAPRILHLGVGGFHRAHMALYTDELAEGGGDWGIRGSGCSTPIAGWRACSTSQDHLYTLIERDSDGSRPRIVGSIVDYVLVAGDDAAFAQQIADPDVAILSMTITEGGYSLEQPNPTIEAIADRARRSPRGGRRAADDPQLRQPAGQRQRRARRR